MSCYESERGVVKLSTKVFGKFRREMAEAFNQFQDLQLLAAQTLHEEVVAQIKGKRRPIDWDVVFRSSILAVEKRSTTITYGRFGNIKESKFQGVEWWEIHDQILKLQEGEMKLVRPLKKDFKSALITETAYKVPGGRLFFDTAERLVTWSISDNNHAVRDAWDSPMGRAFNASLGRVEWTRDTGGKFVYSNENQRDGALDHEGGGGSTISNRFGPLGMADDSPSRPRRKCKP